MNKLIPLLAFSVLLLVPAWAPSVFANPGNTEIVFFGGPTGPQNRFGFGISDPDGIDEIITSQGTILVECKTSTILSIISTITITIVDCEPDGDTTTWTLTTTGVTCISGSCLPPGGSCAVSPSEVVVILAPGASSQVIPKSIDCNGGPSNVDINTDDCSDKGIDVSFDNTGIPIFLWNGDETITNDDNAVPGDVTCLVSFAVENFLGIADISQKITITTPAPQVVGGELIPIETTSLILAGAQSFSWMIPIVLSGIGIGLFVFRKSENS